RFTFDGLTISQIPCLNVRVMERKICLSVQKLRCYWDSWGLALIRNIWFISNAEQQNFGTVQCFSLKVQKFARPRNDIARHRVINLLREFYKTERIPKPISNLV